MKAYFALALYAVCCIAVLIVVLWQYGAITGYLYSCFACGLAKAYAPKED